MLYIVFLKKMKFDYNLLPANFEMYLLSYCCPLID
jgi:hypothetical protein